MRRKQQVVIRLVGDNVTSSKNGDVAGDDDCVLRCRHPRVDRQELGGISLTGGGTNWFRLSGDMMFVAASEREALADGGGARRKFWPEPEVAFA